MIGISAQVSLYPLKQAKLSPTINEVLRIFHSHGLDVQPGTMSTLVAGDDCLVFAALQEAFQRVAEKSQVVMIVTFSNACPIPEEDEQMISFTAIGHVENQFRESASPEERRSVESRIVLNVGLEEGLKGLGPGKQLMVVFYFHRSEGYDLLQHPRGEQDRPRRGVFALCSPRRPNPVGVTVVDLVDIEDNVLLVRGLDALNGTPVLDLKPV